MFISAPQKFSPAQLVNLFKGITAKKLAEQFPELRIKHGALTGTYYVDTAGTLTYFPR
ncbi:transposase [Fervidobacterium thailandense]|uniref:transposase n=1 Tax=Fervidobacterium thailandense TaxID=1008305 RepID=UPI001F4D6734|nr:transposase [Fervidobacterium thailandense]